MNYSQQQSDIIKNKITNDGYVIIDFHDLDNLFQIQKVIQSTFSINPVKLHHQSIEDSVRIAQIKNAKDELVRNNYVKKLLLKNLNLFDFLFSPDIDVQSNIHLRISRPNAESDLVDWHRDTFYGNTLWEINCWFPVFPLSEGAGLTVVNGSHLEQAKNIRFIEDSNLFRQNVIKGSIANELGYVYAPKIDDSIASIDPASIRLLSPKIGQAIFFFGHMIHRAQNKSDKTRISIDVRLKNMFSPTNTKPGYYQPFTRSCIAQYVEKMQVQGVLCGN